MKILQRGVAPELKPIRFECRHCHSVMEATQQEAHFIPDQRDGSFWRIICPVCTQFVTTAARP